MTKNASESRAAGLSLRWYQEGDETAISRLFKQSYGREMDVETWRWRFRLTPASEGLVALAWDGDNLAAHYAVSVLATRVNGVDRLTGLSGTTMTHPNYRGIGLFPELARMVYDKMATLGMAMVWGFPNIQSHRGFVRELGWEDLWEVPTLRAPIAALPARAPGTVKVLPAFDERFDTLWQRARDHADVSAVRARADLEWRYVQNPARDQYRVLAVEAGGDLEGYAVTKRYRDEIHLVDFLVAHDAAQAGIHLLTEAGALGAETGASAISLWLSLTNPFHHVLEKLGFHAEGPVTYLGAKCLDQTLDAAQVLDCRNWYLTMGDSDVY